VPEVFTSPNRAFVNHTPALSVCIACTQITGTKHPPRPPPPGHQKVPTGRSFRHGSGLWLEASAYPAPSSMPSFAATAAANRARARSSGLFGSILPGQHASPVQHLERLSHGASGTLGLLSDPLIRREAGPGAGIVKAPQQCLQDVQESAGHRAAVLPWLGVQPAPGGVLWAASPADPYLCVPLRRAFLPGLCPCPRPTSGDAS
jgi:hypothetical protein